MGFFQRVVEVVLLMFLLCGINYTDAISSQPKVFNVINYGAKADAKTDNTQAFLKAWNQACQWKGISRVLIPYGTYKLGSIILTGPCKGGSITFLIKGVLKALTDQSSLFTDHWITFRYINGLTVTGGGSLDGQGASAWPLNDCHKNAGCKRLPVTMRFDFVTNSNINHITSINSKNSHFNIFGGKYFNFSDITITAPADSPNTDGIHIGESTEIRIFHSTIATGDDCISFSSGSGSVSVVGVTCGPGHGISVGSLGRGQKGDTVRKLTVKNCTFTGSTNGIRIKTWAQSFPGVASEFRFEDILMNNVYNPIIIDQEYCPYPPCRQEVPSKVQISNVTFSNIHGISSSKVAVNLKCSKSLPCKDIKLENINLVYHGEGGPATSNCSYVNGGSRGYQNPRSCI